VTIKDMFGCKLTQGDWVIYAPIHRDSLRKAELAYGQIDKFIGLGIDNIVYDAHPVIEITGSDHVTMPYLTVRFDPQERLMRKLESE